MTEGGGDFTAREWARDIRRNIQLQAPAGSGKTTVLAQRFLAALAAVDEPEEVLAITFTRKAAAEMRERVLAALADRLPAQPERERWQQLREAVAAQAARREWSLEELPQRLRIQTIDSLAAELARAMPVLGRMQASLRVVDDAAQLHMEAARRTLREGEADPDYHADINLLLQRLDNNLEQAGRLLAALLVDRNRWLELLVAHPPEALARQVEESLERIVRAALEHLHRTLPQDWLAEAAHLAREAARNRAATGADEEGNWRQWLEDSAALGSDVPHLCCWQAVADLLLTDKDTLRQKIDKNRGFPARSQLKERWQAWRDGMESADSLLTLLADTRVLPPVAIARDEHETIAALARVLLLAAAQLKLVFRERGLVDHAEVAAIARQALRAGDEDAGFSLRQTLRVAHLLVDECQDTSPDQLELVRALTAGWQRGDQRSLFLVGDPMQSIYLFRGSEVGLFLQTRQQGVGDIRLEPVQLVRNFRSQAPLVQWANSAFQRIFPPVEDLRSSAVTFLAAQHARAADERIDAEVTVWAQPVDDAVAEARQIAGEIAALRARQPGLSVAVLVRTRKLAAPVLRALQDAGIPTAGVDLAALADRTVVRDLVAMGQALLDAGDRRAWLAVLRAPACGLTLEDLLRLSESASARPLPEVIADETVQQQLSADGCARLRRAGPVLLAAWRARASQDLATLLESCWQTLGGEAACLDATELAAGRQYLLALRRLQEVEGRPAPARLQDLAARLKDRNVPAGENPVEVLTIHHAKGLEWDVVFVPGLGSRARGNDSPLLRWLQLPRASGSTDLLLAVRSIGVPNASDPLAAYIRKLQRERLRNERLRLLYVAVTRARLRLYLSGHAPLEARSASPRPAAESLLELLWPAVREQFVLAAGAAPSSADVLGEEAPLRMLWHRLPADFTPAALPSLPTPASLSRALAESTAGAVEYSWVGPLARAAGTVMHGELERLARHGIAGIDNLPGRVAACEAQLRAQGIEIDAARSAARELVARLESMVAEETARWLLFTPHREAASEVALSGILAGELRSVVIDRMFIDAQGTRWIVDYKTGVHAGGGLEEFVAREVERYTPQLRLYARLAARLGQEPVRTALYFPWLGALREVDAAPVS